ncbi:hypothetical protein TVAG_071290 [Trichomonas vaginalis G3]|uniref:Uncharacterized protein n=1 Tax=Trichomonas vaginalis (strain ATCC PRA-98 / G3) TaxID=412133 RepID=A2D832_TRIV3|nr:NTF2-like family [Trichomonas vaginalis G3]EAY23465.1 hypothetical protein TVAG_071290 [Trichomonas vaginalis G3]KAI5493882.1 NTF2-like family [Trichomonas vaginalis G3]|eukprot:XP_001584451.1 hypothetical protein [Trichomonas vaginalis G3]
MSRNNNNRRFGLIAGPSGPDQDRFIEQLKNAIISEGRIEGQNLTFKQYPDHNCVSIEATTYEEQKAIAELSGKININGTNILFSITHLDDLNQYFENFKNVVPKAIRGDKTDLSMLFKRFNGFKFSCNFPQAMSSLLFYTGLYALSHNNNITIINLAKNNMTNYNGMRLIGSYFPSLKIIFIGGNKFKSGEGKPPFLGDFDLRDEIPPLEIQQESDHSDSDSESAEETKKQEVYVDPPPMINFEYIEEKKVMSTIDFDECYHNDDYVTKSQLRVFLIPFLRCLSDNPQNASNYYTDTAVLSLLTLKPKKKPETPLSLYDIIATDITRGVARYWRGSEITEGLKEIFPIGFKHKISYLVTHQIHDELYSIVFHGACIGKECFPFYYDRTLTLKKENNVYFVCNDCITLRDEKRLKE